MILQQINAMDVVVFISCFQHSDMHGTTGLLRKSSNVAWAALYETTGPISVPCKINIEINTVHKMTKGGILATHGQGVNQLPENNAADNVSIVG